MKAVFYNEHGGPEVLQCGELDAPAVRPGTIRIDVKAASVNHLDIFMRRGMPGIHIPFPQVPGCDAAGIVSELGDGVTGPAVGDRVLIDPSISCGACEFCQRGDVTMCLSYQLIGEHTRGTFSEQIVVPARNAIPVPEGLSFEEAASIPLVFVTAWTMLITRGRLRAGEDVLILGGAAGVGIACIQIAKAAGARVFAAASTQEKLDLCKSLGADVLINYGEEDFARRIRKETNKRGVDVVVDYIGQDTWADSLKSARRGGRILTCGATTGYSAETDLRHVFYRQLEIIGSTMGPKNDLESAVRLIADGRMRPVLGGVFDLADTADAHQAIEARSVLGKLVVRV